MLSLYLTLCFAPIVLDRSSIILSQHRQHQVENVLIYISYSFTAHLSEYLIPLNKYIKVKAHNLEQGYLHTDMSL